MISLLSACYLRLITSVAVGFIRLEQTAAHHIQLNNEHSGGSALSTTLIIRHDFLGIGYNNASIVCRPPQFSIFGIWQN